jgi:ssDNA-specific exonuclease RecJ
MHKEIIKPLNQYPLQAFYTDKIQLYGITEAILTQLTQPVTAIYITSFSVSEEFLRIFFRIRQQTPIHYATLILDSKAAIKVERILPFARKVFDDLFLTNNHGKVILIQTPDIHISVCTSQNQTRGNRREATIITTDDSCYQSFLTEIIHITNTAVKR